MTLSPTHLAIPVYNIAFTRMSLVREGHCFYRQASKATQLYLLLGEQTSVYQKRPSSSPCLGSSTMHQRWSLRAGHF